MDKLSTEWRPLSITTMFRIRTQNDQPVICASPRSERSYTEPCGLGWRFAIFYSHYSQSIMFEYDSHYAHRGLGTLQVTLTLSGEDTPEGEYVMREMRPAEPEKRTPIAAWPASAFVQHRLLAFKVDLREPIDVPPPTGLAPSIRQALGDSTRTGTFIDTRFFVYSRRAPSGRVWHPLPLYANGVLLGEKSDYMNTLLNVQGFAESTPGDISTAFPADGNPFTDAYEYASDSDLDDEDDSAADLAADRTLLRRNTVPTQEAQLIVRTPTTAHPMTERDRTNSTSSTTSSSVPLGPIPLELSGRTIHVKDIAFRTWQSLVFYLYTGDVSFLPLRSDRTRSREEVTDQHLADHPHDPPPCSPKSMYRCAEKLGLEELERLAFQAIRTGLNERNILQEVFSRFTSKYPVISEMQTDLLVREHYDSPAVAHAFAEIMGPVAEGELPHSGPVLTSIFERLAKRGRGAGSGS